MCQILRIFGIVEDQQPSIPPMQFSQHRALYRIQIRAGPGTAQLRGQRRELLRDRCGLLRGDPPHHVVICGEPVRVLDCQLRLAYAAHTVQCLNDCPLPAQQLLPHFLQELRAPGEPKVPGRDASPYPARQPRRRRGSRLRGVVMNDRHVTGADISIPAGICLLVPQRITIGLTLVHAGHYAHSPGRR